MVWIEATASYQSIIHAPRAEIIAFIRDIPVVGRLFPGVDRIEVLGEDRYRWVIEERRTLGVSFIGNYVAQYTVGERAITWTTLEGNMKTRGGWWLDGPDGRVAVTVRSTTELDAPVPRFLKKPAELFAVKETKDGIRAQLEGIKSAVEAPNRNG